MVYAPLRYIPLFALPPHLVRAIGQDKSISKIVSTSAKSALDFLRRAFNWLSKLAASGNTATIGADFLFAVVLHSQDN
ncbi:hypothetical protein [Microcoleus sp. F4-D5]|uniref:hypothetical protein n=1 Tax=Microcoleus sp. F4-D5 TaxID=2818760 RepID=UPI002FD2E985